MSREEVFLGTKPWSVDCDDALAWLAALPERSMDLCMFSPPYEAKRSYGINFNLRGQDWVDWMVKVMQACLRVCKGLVACVCDGSTSKYRWSAVPSLLEADLHRAGVNLRNPIIYHRKGICGSGGPDWLRGDCEHIVCATHGGRLPWSDNVAMGNPPKYAPGGEISHRTQDGSRINGKKRLGRGTCKGTEGSPKGAVMYRLDPAGYRPPKIANPGNLVKCLPAENELLLEVFFYGYATKTGPGEVLQTLQKAVNSQTLFQWCSGIVAGLRSAALLQPDLYGGWRENASQYFLQALQKDVQTGTCRSPVPQPEVLRLGTKEEDAGRDRKRRRKKRGGQAGSEEGVSTLWNDGGPSSSPQGREPKEQCAEQSGSSLPAVSRPSSQSTYSSEPNLLCLWSEPCQEVQEIRHLVRQALPALQEAWSAASSQDQAWESLGDLDISDVIHLSVGGGKIGDRLAHETEAPYPEQLCEFFIKSFCPPGGIVCDPMCGSGTTVAVAVKNDRRGIGCDIRQSQVELSEKRIVRALDPPSEKKPAKRRIAKEDSAPSLFD
jgi:DNA modification methylase